jgi:hypothetical protein
MTNGYIAGLFDGEGCIQFSRTRSSTFPRVLVVNTNLGILEELRQQFGGDIKPLALRRAGWRQGWQWRLSWARAVEFLDRIYRHLRIKRLQAQTVFAWAAVAPGRGREWDREALALLVDRMRWLNQKGPTIGEDPIAIAMSKAGKGRRSK